MPDNEKESRREFLARAATAGTAFMFLMSAGAAAFVAFEYILPPARSMDIANKPMLAGSVSEIPAGKSKELLYGNTAVLVINVKGEFKAFNAKCTHLGCIVKWSESKGVFICPCHNGTFDTNGNVVSGPPPRPLGRIAVQVKEDKIYVGGES
ncbi:MAG: ubiquinol-cytochrome c reductase iron-sulfur subunit [Firmicutes bacterium]|nr:ubiquinol-cytochrome c reductase iron-sulfur subunit [Bacillota bacterium]